MQTFFPFPDLTRSAAALDPKRLGKQRVEIMQILNILEEKAAGEFPAWSRHPAVLMWEGHATFLCEYGIACCREWITRGYEDNLLPRFERAHRELLADNNPPTKPKWFGVERFHETHRAMLFEKSPVLYPKFKTSVAKPCCDGCSYYWPTHDVNYLDPSVEVNNATV